MFSLTPWKKRSSIKVRHDEPRPMTDWGYSPLARWQTEWDSWMDQLFSDSLWPDWPALRQWDLSSVSRWDWDFGLEDAGDEYLARAELPGFEPEDFEVKVSGNTVTVRAEHRDEKKSKRASGYRYGSYCQSFTIPQGVDTERIDARYHSGVLELHLPKSEQARGKRIEVKSA